MVVSTTSDIVADDGLCSLSEAITAANTDTASGATAGECAAGSGADRIDIPTGAYTLSGGSPLVINSDLTLNEAGGPITIILGDVFIINGAKLRILGDVALDISGDLTVEAGSELSADAGGYPGDNGPGAGQAGGFRIGGGGGGHGGIGGQGVGIYGQRSGGAAYGDDLSPTTPGSGGGGSGYANAPGGYGGGHLDLMVGGTLTVDGTISANGADGVTYSTYAASGGGAGGSIQVSAGTLAGSGTVQANGGNGGISSYAWSGGGAGSRISLNYTSLAFTGTVQAIDGNGYNETNESGTVAYNNTIVGGWCDSGSPMTNCLVSLQHTLPNIAALVFAGELIIDDGGQLKLQSGYTTTITATGITIQSGGGIVGRGTLALDISGDLTVEAGSELNASELALGISGDLTVEAGSELSADAGGYAGDNGPGAGQAGGFRIGGGGGGHGGIGGQGGGLGVRSGGAAYGDDLCRLFTGHSGHQARPGHSGGGRRSNLHHRRLQPG